MHHEHDRPPHLRSQHPVVCLKSGRSSSLAHSKSKRFMAPWTPSKSLDPFTHICPPFLYPLAVEKHHEHERPPQLPSQHPNVRLKSGQSGSLAHSKSNMFTVPWTPSGSLDPLTHICHVLPFHTHWQWKSTMNTNGHLNFSPSVVT